MTTNAIVEGAAFAHHCRYHRSQGPAGEPVGSRRRGRCACGLRADLALRSVDDACSPHSRGRSAKTPTKSSCPLLGGDTGSGAATADGLDHRVRRVCRRAGWSAAVGPTPATAWRRRGRCAMLRSVSISSRWGRSPSPRSDLPATNRLIARYLNNSAAQCACQSGARSCGQRCDGPLRRPRRRPRKTLCCFRRSAAIDVASVPLSAAGRKLLASGAISFEVIVSGGDDYEILCAISEDCYDALAQEAKRAGVAVTTIGTVIAGTADDILHEGRELTLGRLR